MVVGTAVGVTGSSADVNGMSVGAVTTPVAGVDVAAVAYGQDLLALTHVQVVDGTGSPAKADMTVVVGNGHITQVSPAAAAAIPPGATVIDGTGKTLLPGLVMMHEHMFYPTGGANYTEMLSTFPPLYLAGGTTTARTAGAMAPYADLNLRREITSGSIIGPDLDVTGPYLNGPGLPILKVHPLSGPSDAVRTVNYWADEGVTSFKGYTNLSRAMLTASLSAAHARGTKMTAHLCSITYREAAAMGVDNLEHGLAVATDFVPGKQPDVCPDQKLTDATLANLDVTSQPVKELIDLLVRKHVALTSTLTVFETFTPGRPEAPEGARALLLPQLRAQYEARWNAVQKDTQTPWIKAFEKEMRLERMFAAAGGVLMAGTDPTGYGGVLPGYSAKRQIELLVEAGFSLEQAVQISTLNGAQYLGRDQTVGSIETGKQADLVLIDGDPVKDLTAINRMPLVFKKGVGYRTEAIFEAMQGKVGLF